MEAIFDLPLTLTSESILLGTDVLLDTENVGVVVGISSLSSVITKMYVITYSLKGDGGHL